MKNLLYKVAYVVPDLNGGVRVNGLVPPVDVFSAKFFSCEATEEVFPLFSCLKSFSSKSS